MSIEVRTSVAAAVTNRDGRALLGVAADYLQRAYEIVPQLTNMADVQDSARELLDRVNQYAQGIYRTLPDDDDPLDETARARIQVALLQAETNLDLVREVDAELRVDYLQALADVVPAGIAAVGTAVAGAAFDHWVLSAAAVVLGFLLVRFFWPRGAAA